MWSNTSEMSYSTKYHMYILNPEPLKNDLGLDFVATEGSLTKAKDKLYQISRAIYSFIILHHAGQEKLVEYWLAMDETLRPTILEVLQWQARYEMRSSVSAVKQQTGINFQNGIVIKPMNMRGEIAYDAEALNILENSQLLFRGKYRTTVDQTTLNYTTMGY